KGNYSGQHFTEQQFYCCFTASLFRRIKYYFMSVIKHKNIFIDGAISSSFIAERIQAHHDKLNIGGHSLFLGQVRADDIENKTVTAIEYTAYQELALEKMTEIREQTFTKYDMRCM